MANPNLHENKIKRAFVYPFAKILKKCAPVTFVKGQYRYITHHRLNLQNPVRYTEKLQYLRLFVYPKMPLVSYCASRFGGRDYVRNHGFQDYLIPAWGPYRHYADIHFERLPRSFIIKCNHASGFNYLVDDKDKINHRDASNKIEKWLQTDYGELTLERHYSAIARQLIIEKRLGEGELPIEYKIHCFNGKAKNLYVVIGRGKDIHYNQFYIDWSPFPASQFNGWTASQTPPRRPDNFQEMIYVAETLAKPFPFVRIDFFDINNHIYFNEFTFTPAKGTLRFDDDKADFEQGEWLDISEYLSNSK